MSENIDVKRAAAHFTSLIEQQLQRIEEMKQQDDFINYDRLGQTIIGICGGDGIGPIITAEARRVLEFLLAEPAAEGKIQFRLIKGLTLANRLTVGKAIPDDVLAELKACHVILKGPTTTPQKGDGCQNIESANVAMRKELDLFANIRPVKVPAQGINWTLFRENTEGAYALGNQGVEIGPDLAIDFTVTTKQGTERLARLAYDFAAKNGFARVSLVSKANVIKTTDGNFLADCRRVAAGYPQITTDEWYADIIAAKLIDEKRRRDFQVIVLPNLYGDIISDEAAEFQGGVGTAGAANTGTRYAMFEAIHGSAPRMIAEGRGDYADPCSMLRAAAMLLAHIGYQRQAAILGRALDICMFEEKKLTVTGRATGCTCRQFADYLLAKLQELA